VGLRRTHQHSNSVSDGTMGEIKATAIPDMRGPSPPGGKPGEAIDVAKEVLKLEEKYVTRCKVWVEMCGNRIKHEQCINDEEYSIMFGTFKPFVDYHETRILPSISKEIEGNPEDPNLSGIIDPEELFELYTPFFTKLSVSKKLDLHLIKNNKKYSDIVTEVLTENQMLQLSGEISSLFYRQPLNYLLLFERHAKSLLDTDSNKAAANDFVAKLKGVCSRFDKLMGMRNRLSILSGKTNYRPHLNVPSRSLLAEYEVSEYDVEKKRLEQRHVIVCDDVVIITCKNYLIRYAIKIYHFQEHIISAKVVLMYTYLDAPIKQQAPKLDDRLNGRFLFKMNDDREQFEALIASLKEKNADHSEEEEAVYRSRFLKFEVLQEPVNYRNTCAECNQDFQFLEQKKNCLGCGKLFHTRCVKFIIDSNIEVKGKKLCQTCGELYKKLK